MNTRNTHYFTGLHKADIISELPEFPMKPNQMKMTRPWKTQPWKFLLLKIVKTEATYLQYNLCKL